MKKTFVFAVTAATAVAAGSASAAITAYSDQAAWEADLIAMGLTPFTETFDGISIPTMQPSGSPYVVNDDFSITVEGMEGSADDAFIAGGEFHGEIFPDSEHSAYVHMFNQPIMAFGQNYDGAASGLGIRLETTEGTVDIFDDGGYSGFEDGFFGFIVDAAIMEVRVIGSDADGGSAVGEIYDALDASYAMIPAPGAMALLGVAGLVGRRRRRL